MIKCDFCKKREDCCETLPLCILNGYQDFEPEQIFCNADEDKLISLLRGKSLDTDDDVEYVAAFLLENGVYLL